MSSATLNLKVTPRRMLTASEAADYCGLSRKRFPSICQVAPVKMPGGDVRYDMRDLDTWVDDLKMGVANGDDDIIRKLTG